LDRDETAPPSGRWRNVKCSDCGTRRIFVKPAETAVVRILFFVVPIVAVVVFEFLFQVLYS